MTRNLRTLSLALAAIFSLGALVAATAQAQGKFTWAPGTQELTTEQDGTGATGTQTLRTTTGTIQCEEASDSVQVSGTEATEVTAQNIKYQNVGKVEQCNGPLGTHPKWDFNGCDYLFTVGETIGTTGMETTGQMHIKCPVGKQITFQAPGCQIHIPEQTPTGGHVIYHTVTGTPNYITKEFTLTGIHYQGTELCSSGTDATYTGNFIIKGYNGTIHDAAHQTSIEVE